jgi:hypothetical protein
VQFKDTVFPDIKLVLDDDMKYVGILSPDGIEACALDTAFLSDRKVLSGYGEARRSIGRILKSQLGLDLPKGFSVDVEPEDLIVFCTQVCPVEYMDDYLQKKRIRTAAAMELWKRERPWDSNPMTAAQAGAENYTFDAETGLLGTDGHINLRRRIELPSSIGGGRVTGIKTGAFVSYPNLEEIVIPESVTQIEPYAFYDKIFLKRANIPSGVKSISDGVFSRCRALASIVIPDTVEEICTEAFYQCSSLATVVVPDSVARVGQCAFIGVPHVIYHGAAVRRQQHQGPHAP